MSNITVLQPDNAQQGGLFGYIGAGASITDLHFENVTYTAVGSKLQGSTFGLLCGTLSDQATLQNVTISGKLLIDPSLFLENVDGASYGILAGMGNAAGISTEQITVEATGDQKNRVILSVNRETGEITLTPREQN